MTIYRAPPDQVGLVLNTSDFLFVDDEGIAYDTTINAQGSVIVDYGLTVNTTINHGGQELVGASAEAKDTTINSGGNEVVSRTGLADNVTFGTPGGVLQLENPVGLTGTLTNWRVGDVVYLRSAYVFALREVGHELQMTYSVSGIKGTADFTLADQQPNTKVIVHFDGRGTALELVSVVGIPQQHDEQM